MKPDYAQLAAEADGRAKHLDAVAGAYDADARDCRRRAENERLYAQRLRDMAKQETETV